MAINKMTILIEFNETYEKLYNLIQEICINLHIAVKEKIYKKYKILEMQETSNFIMDKLDEIFKTKKYLEFKQVRSAKNIIKDTLSAMKLTINIITLNNNDPLVISEGINGAFLAYNLLKDVQVKIYVMLLTDALTKQNLFEEFGGTTTSSKEGIHRTISISNVVVEQNIKFSNPNLSQDII